jgi:hypothetical protein
MSPTPVAQLKPGMAAHAYRVTDFRVVSGANHGDPLGGAGSVEPGDIFHLAPSALPQRLTLAVGATGGQVVALGSAIGLPGEAVSFLGALTLMAPDGDRAELLVVRLEDSGDYALPFSPLRARTDYTLIEVSADPGARAVVDVICVSFAAGTLITMPGGAQRPIESLRAGETVLTRSNGPQTVRWIGKATLRAAGAFAPVVISAGVLGNSHDLVVSPHHRVFLYQRGQRRIGATAEILIQAKHLVDGDRVFRREGGFVDYYSLVFDRHEIIYAEGIAAESLMVTEATLTVLPEEIGADLRAQFPGLRHSPHYGTEIDRGTIAAAGLTGLIRTPKP